MKVTAALVLALIPGIALSAEHGSKGFEFESEDGRYLLQIDSRMQFRFSHSSDDNPVSLDAEPDQTSFEFRRACLKVGGHAIHDWLRYYWEFDFLFANPGASSFSRMCRSEAAPPAQGLSTVLTVSEMGVVRRPMSFASC